MSLESTRKGITDTLNLLRKGEWQIPKFQREFIWSPEQVKKLVNSFIKSYPIGLLTIWDQPQDNPHTPGMPLEISGTEFKAYDKDPSVIKLVLDGKQRLTTLAMVFGGFHIKDERYTYSGSWFIDIDAYAEGRESSVVLYKRQKEIVRDGLNVLTNCVRKAIIPLKDFEKLGDYLSQINNSEIYPEDQYPAEEVRTRRSTVINALLNNFSQFQIPVAEIPKTVDLGAVCEIFDVLNTTGTKVSTFDLIHNLLFSESGGNFDLRDKFSGYKDQNNFGFLCDDDRKEFLCQLITGCYILERNPVKAHQKDISKIETVNSIKGKDLIGTPLSFYTEFDGYVPKVDSYTNDLFTEIFGGIFRLVQIPYPAQVILYISLRWNLELRLKSQSYSIDELNRVYRAFFWRNTLSNRYDQGYLTQFTTDLKFLDDLLTRNMPNRGNNWSSIVNEELNNFFGGSFKARSKEDILDIVRDGETKGALAQGINLLISSKTTHDLLTGDLLNRFTDEASQKVQLHHLFPAAWCKDNSGRYTVLEPVSQRNNFANLIPLTAKSNNKWKTLSPSTAIRTYGLEFETNVQRFESGFIDHDAFKALTVDDVETFWKIRAEKIADTLYNFQSVN